jgi:hypothetical protein
MQEFDVETPESYLERKYREISLINSCLARPFDLAQPQSVAAAIDQKFLVAAALKAERCLLSWKVTETAGPSAQYWKSGGFEFLYGYQRADLSVRGPPIYKAIRFPPVPVFQDTTYTCSGMSALAAVLSALSMVRGKVELLIPPDCYSETRELLDRFSSIRLFVSENWRHLRQAHGVARVVLIDSSARSSFPPLLDRLAREADLVLFDTTCLWQSSARIRRVLAWALQSGLPVALVRSHAKLDSLGIEYGRLGSVVMAAPLKDVRSGRLRWVENLGEQVRESVRLLGVAPVLAHFPPFAGEEEFERCSIARTAAIIRNNRRMTRRLATAFKDSRRITAYRHGLYFTLSPEDDMRADDVKHLAAALSAELSRHGLPVRHSGSFGFDFTAIDCFREPLSGSNVIRVAASDIPVGLVDQVTDRIACWWSLNGFSTKSSPAPARRSSYAGG